MFNKIEYSVACLRSIAEHASATPFEVIVVDDGSSDATPERLAQISGIRVHRNERNLGFVGSCNAGAALARGEFVLFLNNDTQVTSGWLDALLRCFADEPDAGLVGAKLVYPDGRLQEAGGIVFRDGSGWNYGRFEDPHDPRYDFRREADYCSGAAIMIRHAFFDELGGFDTRYAPAYYEDTDLAFAVRAAGKKVFYEPRSRVVHFEGITSGTDVGAGIKRYQVVNRGKFAEKWKNELRAQPAPIDSAKLAPAAANFRTPRRVLIIDAYTPTPDQDSGSLRMVNLMRLLRSLGYRVSFIPDNYAHFHKYTEALQALGVEALYHPRYVGDPVAWLRENGASLDAIILSRHYVASNYIGLARLYAPQARLIFDTVDLHYLREERAAALDRQRRRSRATPPRRSCSELKLMRECDLTLVVSTAEQRLLARAVPNVRVAVLSNVHEVYGRRRGFAERKNLVFVGGFQHPPNIDAVQWYVRGISAVARARSRNRTCTSSAARSRTRSGDRARRRRRRRARLRRGHRAVHGRLSPLARAIALRRWRQGQGQHGDELRPAGRGDSRRGRRHARAQRTRGLAARCARRGHAAGIRRRHPACLCRRIVVEHPVDQRPRKRALALFVRGGTCGARGDPAGLDACGVAVVRCGSSGSPSVAVPFASTRQSDRRSLRRVRN